MITASRLAGFFAAHAIWSVSESDDLVPILAQTDFEGNRQMSRLAMGGEQAVEHGQQLLEKNEADAMDATLLYQGWIQLDEGKVDAMIIELRTYPSLDSRAVYAIPYTPKSSGTFKVHSPKILAWEHCDDFDMNAAMEAFFEGVEEHEEGARVWHDALDESL